MQQIEMVREHDLVHPHREREIVRWILEQRIPPDIDFMEVDPWLEGGQPERLLIRDEVHFVPASGERDAQLGGDGARAAIRRVTRNADIHAGHGPGIASGEALRRH